MCIFYFGVHNVDLANHFPVNKKTAFRLSSDPDEKNHYCLVKKTKDPLVAVVVSNKEKYTLSLDIGDDLLLLSEQQGETWATKVKVAQNQSHPLIILHIEREPSPIAFGDVEKSPAPISEIELIDGEDDTLAIDETTSITKERLLEEEDLVFADYAEQESNGQSVAEQDYDEISDMSIVYGNREIDLGDIDEDPMVESLFVAKASPTRAALAPITIRTMGFYDFFSVSISFVDEENAGRLAKSIENNILLKITAEQPAKTDVPLTLPEGLDPAMKIAMEMTLDRIGKIEKAVENIGDSVGSAKTVAPSKGATIAGTCIGIRVDRMQIALDKAPDIGSQALLIVNRQGHPHLQFTALAEINQILEVNDLFMADFSFTAIHPNSMKVINEYKEHGPERLDTLKEMALLHNGD